MARPKVVIYGVASVDGRITTAPGVLLMFGDERWEAVAGSSDVYRWIQDTHKPQAFIEGSGSLVPIGSTKAPDPLPAVQGDPQPLYEDYLPEEVIHRPGHRGWFTMVDSGGRIRWAYKEWPDPEWEGWHLLVLVAHQTPAAYLAYLRREAIPYLVAGQERVDLGLALEKLNDRLEITSVLSTSPGKLGGALLRAGLVDEINIEFFPAVIGGTDTPTLFESPALALEQGPARLKLLSAQVQAEGRVWLRYEVL
jgi:2,5-diamino-6-(ribosylamino)-4(3H)-pyrimidinone 5'-phosphate reductase